MTLNDLLALAPKILILEVIVFIIGFINGALKSIVKMKKTHKK